MVYDARRRRGGSGSAAARRRRGGEVAGDAGRLTKARRGAFAWRAASFEARLVSLTKRCAGAAEAKRCSAGNKKGL